MYITRTARRCAGPTARASGPARDAGRPDAGGDRLAHRFRGIRTGVDYTVRVRVGDRHFDNGLGLVDKTAVGIGDSRTLDRGSIAQVPSLETNSFLLKGDVLPEGVRYGGNPVRGLFAASPAVAAWNA